MTGPRLKDITFRAGIVLVGIAAFALAVHAGRKPASPWGDMAPIREKELNDGYQRVFRAEASRRVSRSVRDDQGFGTLADARRDDWVLQGSSHRLPAPAPGQGGSDGPREGGLVHELPGQVSGG